MTSPFLALSTCSVFARQSPVVRHEPTMSAQRPLPVPLSSSMAWSGLVALDQVPLSCESPWGPLASSKGWEFLQWQPGFYMNMRGCLHQWTSPWDRSWFAGPFFCLFSTSRAQNTHKEPPFPLLWLEEEAWHELWAHTNLALNPGPSTCSLANYLTFLSPTFLTLKMEMRIFLL